MEILELVLAVGLVARLTRLVVFDDAGFLVRTPVRIGARAIGRRRGIAWADRLLACPFCAGYWIALVVAASWAAWGGTTAWRAFALAGTASYLAGHLAVTLDDRDL